VGRKHDRRRRFGGVLTRLRADMRGNVLIMTAFALIPMLAMTGAAIDMSRLYVVKVRLQEACDAGVLAGRKFMDTTNTSTTLDTNAAAQARLFFTNNYHNGWYGTSTPVFTPSKTSDSQVSGTATTRVPMAVMQMFGSPAITLNVTCQARYDIADADVMFVLDTTGSMGCLTSDNQSTCDSYVVSNTVTNPDGSYSVTEKSNSRIAGLRSAVLSFFDTVTSSADASTNFRFGFVPYSGAVNVGNLLRPSGYMTTGNWNYDTRTYVGDANSGSSSTTTSSNVNSCPGANGTTRSLPAGTYNSSGQATNTTYSYNSSSRVCTTTTQTVIANWYYASTSTPIDSYVTGNAVDNPSQLGSTTSTWPGCVEERMSASGETGSTFSATSPPLSLDVDTVPTTNAQRWAPMWTDATFARINSPETTSATRSILSRYSGSTQYDLANSLNMLPCPKAASRLSSMQLPAGSSSSVKSSLRTTIQNYMSASSGFRPYGVTYHDIGMTWGTRLLAPSGIFASDTAAWSGHNSPNRFIIFLTDGTMETQQLAYTSFGMEAYDNRTGAGTNETTATNNHNARLATACTIAKNRNIKVFVIAYSQTLTTQLTNCASPGQAYYAADTAGLNTAFASIAQQVAMLRISQ
jgi:Flp pilus assembly protein TadG